MGNASCATRKKTKQLIISIHYLMVEKVTKSGRTRAYESYGVLADS